MANDGSLNRHGGQADMESNADERARERAEAVAERAADILRGHRYYRCPECDEFTAGLFPHLATCELLRARAEAEVDRG